MRAYAAKKSKRNVCSDYLFENSCKPIYPDPVNFARVGNGLVTNKHQRVVVIVLMRNKLGYKLCSSSFR